MLAVIVLNWNGGQDLIHCLRSVEAQEDCGIPIVVYVPDNASTDGSLEQVRREFPQTRIIQNGGNLGFSGGNNTAWRRAIAEGAEWVFFLNNDATLATDCLKRLLAVCRNNPRIGMASPKIYYGTPESHPDGRPTPGAEPEVWFEKGICQFDFFGGIRHVEAMEQERLMECYESPLCTGCCLLIASHLLTETGGFDEEFFAYLEDVDLSLKIRAKGFLCAVVPGALAWHKVGQSTSHEAIPGYVYYCVRNLYYLAKRHAPPDNPGLGDLKNYFRIIFQLAAIHTGKGELMMAATMLQGFQAAKAGQTGMRPPERPGFRLKATAKAARRIYQVKNLLQRKRVQPASFIKPNLR